MASERPFCSNELLSGLLLCHLLRVSAKRESDSDATASLKKQLAAEKNAQSREDGEESLLTVNMSKGTFGNFGQRRHYDLR